MMTVDVRGTTQQLEASIDSNDELDLGSSSITSTNLNDYRYPINQVHQADCFKE
jgi:hypothetical protein